MIAAVVAGERLGENYRWDNRWPEVSLAKFGQAGALARQGTDPASVKNQGHALRRD